MLVFMVTAIGSTVSAQIPGSLVWTSGPDLPSPRAACVAILAPDNAVILLGGASPSGNQVVPKLPTGAAGWTTAPEIDINRVFPGAVRYSTQGVLVIGGQNGNEPTDEVLLYDYYLGDSQDAEKMSVGRQQFAFASDGSGRAYVMGGIGVSGDILFSAEQYNPMDNSWTDIAPLPEARYGAAGIGVSNVHIYAIGGATSAGIQSNAFRYTIASDTWDTIPSMPVAVRNGVAVFSQNRIYVTGGVSITGPVAVAQVYDLSTGLWTIDTPLPSPRFGHGAVIGALGQLLVAGGYDAAGNASTSVWQSQRLNIPETAPVFNTSPVTTGSLDRAYTYDTGAEGNPAPSFSLIAAPTGMIIQPGSGLVEWQPVAGQAGIHTVTARATNRVGFADQTFNITVKNDTIPPTAPIEVHVVSVTANSVELAWSGASDANSVDHYGVYRKYRCGFHGIQRCYALVQGNISGETTIISGLPSLTSYSYVVRAFDADENQSPNSMVVSFTTLSPPVSFRYAGATTLPANFPLQLQFYANANPPATFSVVSGPPGLTVDSESGVTTWIPSPADVGIHTLIMSAANSGGATNLSVTITVKPDAPQLYVQYSPGAGGARDAVAGSSWSAQILDASHTPSTFEILSAPTGMTIDATSGQLSWLPTVDDAGQTLVIVHAANTAGAVDISFEFYTHFTGPVSNLQVVGLTALNPTATWSPPTGTGSDRVAGYTISARARYRYGRTMRTHSVNYESEGTEPTVLLTGLVAGRTYNLYVNAVDDADHRGLINSNAVSFVPRPGIPSIGWTFSNTFGHAGMVAGQELVVQLTDYNTEFGTSSYSMVSGPADFILNPVTGEGRWTPAADDVGTVNVTIRATNLVGPRDVTISFVVYFSGPVLNAAAVRTENAAVANWQPPADNVFPVVTYLVSIHWQSGSRSYSRAMTTTGTSLPFELIPTGAVWHKGVKIAPVDAIGNVGVSTPLIPYNGALPAELPAADPAWIENVDLDTNGVPVLEIRGLGGVTADVEVTEDFTNWGSLEAVTLGDDGVIHYPDTEGKNTPRSSYRLFTH
jgi:Fibronectin type III domain/Galactose oxidase, central domain